jgi:hypothetical protein
MARVELYQAPLLELIPQPLFLRLHARRCPLWPREPTFVLIVIGPALSQAMENLRAANACAVT